jgi:alpha-aminoadipate/glutamate carrier protein LysW
MTREKLNITGSNHKTEAMQGGLMLYCPECETSLDVEEDEVDEGEVLSCPECGSDFEVTTINPVELKPVEEEEEYDDDDDEESEDGDYS